MAKRDEKKEIEAKKARDDFKKDVRAGTPKRVYAFFGEEKYLLEDALRSLRALVAKGTEEFNHHRLSGPSFSVEALSDAVNSLPAFSEYTLTEVWDVDIGKLPEDARGALIGVLSDVPDYATVVFVFDTAEFKLDGRVKANKALSETLTQVEFTAQSFAELRGWIRRHFAAGGKTATPAAAERLALMTGNSMTAMNMEIEKLISCTAGSEITEDDVKANVAPVTDVAVYELTDAILKGENDRAVRLLGELMSQGEPAQRVVFGISSKLRQVLAAKVYLESGAGTKDLMRAFGIRYEFQARDAFTAARRLSGKQCAELVRRASETALKLNSSSGDDAGLMLELLVRLAAAREAGR